jgi:DNA-binding transcriptional LysR family regulator
MEIRHLKTFLAVAKLLSFNKAAERLHYAQSSVSAQIQALEEELGVQLFDRLGRRIMLTDAGERLIPYAEKIIDLADETRTEIRCGDEPEGALIVRVPESLGVHRLPSAIYEFSVRYPGIRLSLVNCAHEILQKELRSGAIDLAFLLAESFPSADVQVEALGVETLVLLSGPDNPLAKKRLVRTRDLAGETLALSKVDCSYRRLFEKILEEEGVLPKSTPIFHSVEFLKRCVTAGSGITILPEIAVSEEIEKGKLVRLRWEEDNLEVSILMIWSKGRWVSPTLTAFMEMVRKALKVDRD